MHGTTLVYIYIYTSVLLCIFMHRRKAAWCYVKSDACGHGDMCESYYLITTSIVCVVEMMQLAWSLHIAFDLVFSFIHTQETMLARPRDCCVISMEPMYVANSTPFEFLPSAWAFAVVHAEEHPVPSVSSSTVEPNFCAHCSSWVDTLSVGSVSGNAQ